MPTLQVKNHDWHSKPNKRAAEAQTEVIEENASKGKVSESTMRKATHDYVGAEGSSSIARREEESRCEPSIPQDHDYKVPQSVCAKPGTCKDGQAMQHNRQLKALKPMTHSSTSSGTGEGFPKVSGDTASGSEAEVHSTVRLLPS